MKGKETFKLKSFNNLQRNTVFQRQVA